MRISDDERREVAQGLRELRHTTYYREEIVENICDAISIADPVNTFREPEDVYELLADLIDRPTCTMTYKPEWSDDEIYPTSAYQCSNCGSVVNEGITEFCPSCGCMVSNYETEPER